MLDVFQLRISIVSNFKHNASFLAACCRMSDKDRRNPPKKGSIITYKFQELSKSGKPRFPTYLGIRIDMTEPKDAEIRAVIDDDDA